MNFIYTTELNLKQRLSFLNSTFYFFLYSLFLSYNVHSVESVHRYRTSIGKCPSRTTGVLTLKLLKSFESDQSLISLKKSILKEKLTERYFISEYKIKYDPLKKVLDFNFNCPTPLMKAQIYKKNGNDSYEAVLVDTGELVDSTYESLLKDENKLSDPLPVLALPVGEMEKSAQIEIAHIVRDMKWDFKKYLSEIIIDDKKEITMILSINGKPSSVFLGKDEWRAKVVKLNKIIDHMLFTEKLPSVVNMTNSKKVVVKFADKI